jgi:Uma2 family endonuclease
MGEKSLANYTYEAYLALEAESKIKYEYHDGYIVAMAGGSPEHGLIAGNFISAVNRTFQANSKSCAVFTSDVKVHIKSTNRSYYPDASVVCGKFEKSDKDKQAIINPLLILEVLSESTVAVDRGAKFTHYRQIPSLKEYVLISQDEAVVDTYYRVDDGLWEIQTTIGLLEKVVLKSISSEIAMSEIYRMVPDLK